MSHFYHDNQFCNTALNQYVSKYTAQLSTPFTDQRYPHFYFASDGFSTIAIPRDKCNKIDSSIQLSMDHLLGQKDNCYMPYRVDGLKDSIYSVPLVPEMTDSSVCESCNGLGDVSDFIITFERCTPCHECNGTGITNKPKPTGKMIIDPNAMVSIHDSIIPLKWLDRIVTTALIFGVSNIILALSSPNLLMFNVANAKVFIRKILFKRGGAVISITPDELYTVVCNSCKNIIHKSDDILSEDYGDEYLAPICPECCDEATLDYHGSFEEALVAVNKLRGLNII